MLSREIERDYPGGEGIDGQKSGVVFPLGERGWRFVKDDGHGAGFKSAGGFFQDNSSGVSVRRRLTTEYGSPKEISNYLKAHIPIGFLQERRRESGRELFSSADEFVTEVIRRAEAMEDNGKMFFMVTGPVVAGKTKMVDEKIRGLFEWRAKFHRSFDQDPSLEIVYINWDDGEKRVKELLDRALENKTEGEAYSPDVETLAREMVARDREQYGGRGYSRENITEEEIREKVEEFLEIKREQESLVYGEPFKPRFLRLTAIYNQMRVAEELKGDGKKLIVYDKADTIPFRWDDGRVEQAKEYGAETVYDLRERKRTFEGIPEGVKVAILSMMPFPINFAFWSWKRDLWQKAGDEKKRREVLELFGEKILEGRVMAKMGGSQQMMESALTETVKKMREIEREYGVSWEVPPEVRALMHFDEVYNQEEIISYFSNRVIPRELFTIFMKYFFDKSGTHHFGDPYILRSKGYIKDEDMIAAIIQAKKLHHLLGQNYMYLTGRAANMLAAATVYEKMGLEFSDMSLVCRYLEKENFADVEAKKLRRIMRQ